MNTLLGELATYDDIQFPRYRIAIKLRKLQTTFILHHFEVGTLQDIFHSTGLQTLSIDSDVSEALLESIMAEIYGSLKSTTRIEASVLQDAHTTCFNWFVMALQCGTPDSRCTVGALKIILALFCKGKTSEKAQYIFSVLVQDGTVGLTGLQFFCESVQLLANCLQETIYPDVKSVDQAMSECLYLVRDIDDIEDEEEDGGLKRPWLSRFELVKAFTASPPLNFLTWLDLWFHLSTIEKVVHNVKCNICNRKSIKGFRYQCQECSNYNMCQICFLKGRSSEGHKLDHKVLECQDYTKSFKSRFGMSGVDSKVHRVMDEPRDPSRTLRIRPRDVIDGSTGSLNRLDSPVHVTSRQIRSPSSTPEPGHRPAVIRIGGSRDSLNNSPKREATSRHSVASISSAESYEGRIVVTDNGSHGASPLPSSLEKRRPSPIIPSLTATRRATHSEGFMPAPHRSLQRIADEEGAWGRRTFPRGMTKTSSDGRILNNKEEEEFNKLNKKLSLEVDQLLQEIEPQLRNETATSFSSDGSDDLAILGIDDDELQSKHDEAMQKKHHLTAELDSLLGQVQQLHHGFLGLKQGNRVSPLTHTIINTTSHQRTGSLDILNPNLLSANQDNSGRLSVVW